MLLWQPRRWPKRYYFFVQLFGMFFLIHIIVLCGLVILCSKEKRSYALTVSSIHTPSNVHIVFLPLYKTVDQGGLMQTQEVSKIHESKKTSTQQLQIKTIPVKNEKQHAQSTIVKEKKKQNRMPPKTLSVRGVKQTPKPQPQQLEQEKEQKQYPHVTSDSQATTHYIGREELSLLHMQVRIQQMLHTVWKPPVGIAKEVYCQIHFCVNNKGTVERADIYKTSGILLYDISARNAALQLKLSAWAYGKEFCVTFKQ